MRLIQVPYDQAGTGLGKPVIHSQC